VLGARERALERTDTATSVVAAAQPVSVNLQGMVKERLP